MLVLEPWQRHTFQTQTRTVPHVSRPAEDSSTERRAASHMIGRAVPRWHGWIGRTLREPLVHFCVAGALLFAAYGWFNVQEGDQLPYTQKIEISEDDIRRIAAAWLAQGRLPLTPDQLRNLVDQKISEEVLYREGLALGLDSNDEIIKRRIAQKMDFLAADIAALQEPDREELAQWFSRHSDRFVRPPRASFRHLYFSPDIRGDAARADAEAVREALADTAADTVDVAGVSDPFMLRGYYKDSTPNQLLKEFGPDFAAGLYDLEPGRWSGPIQSGYGWHVIWIDKKEAARIPAYEEVEADVRSAWIDARYQEVKRSALDEMRARYMVVVPPLDTIDLTNVMSARPDRTDDFSESLSQ